MHAYLGDLEHVTGCSVLPADTEHRLPILVQPGVVLLPGCTLPLHATHPSEIGVLQRAMSAPPPKQRLVLVIYWPVFGRRRPNPTTHVIGCTAEIKQLRIHPAVTTQLEPERYVAIAMGRQRVAVSLNEWDEDGYVPVRVLSEGSTQRVPPAWRLGYAAVHPAFVKPWDLHALAKLATRLCRAVLPGAAADTAVAGRTSLDLSYSLTANLPIQGAVRQKLLECSCACERLTALIKVLTKLGQLTCIGCGARIAEASHALSMTGEGVGSAFVNAHGHVHDLATMARLASNQCVSYQGQPVTQFSWFPGYAWTICNCSRCGTHLGWRFTCTRADMAPAEFWGLRRDSLTADADPGVEVASPAEGWASARSGSFYSSDSGDRLQRHGSDNPSDSDVEGGGRGGDYEDEDEEDGYDDSGNGDDDGEEDGQVQGYDLAQQGALTEGDEQEQEGGQQHGEGDRQLGGDGSEVGEEHVGGTGAARHV